MSKAPWYKRFAADFVSDPYVRAMTYEQQGWYNAMLDLSWIHTPQGYLPNDKQMLSKCLGLLEQNSRQHFIDNCDEVLARFKTTEDGRFLYHPKMLDQAAHMTQVSEKRRDAGKSGGRKYGLQLQSKCQAIAKQMPVDSDTDSDKRHNGGFNSTESAGYCMDAWHVHGIDNRAIIISVLDQIKDKSPMDAAVWLVEERTAYEQSQQFKETEKRYRLGVMSWLKNGKWFDWRGTVTKSTPERPDPFKEQMARFKAEKEAEANRAN